jgi:hypothetical protein
MEIHLDPDQNSSLSSDTIDLVTEQISIPDGANVTLLNLAYISTSERCFADTRIISETLREILKHVSNKVFFTLIGIVTIFYTITYVLVLHRQNPRIRALKKSLNVLNKFDSYPPTKRNQRTLNSVVTFQHLSTSSLATVISPKQTEVPTIIGLNELNPSNDKQITIKNTKEEQYEISQLINNEDSDDQNLPSPSSLRKSIKNRRKSQSQEKEKKQEQHISISENTSDELQPSTEKLNGTKQVSFRIENRRNTSTNEQNKNLSLSTVSLDGDLDGNNDMYYKLPCPCSTTRQLLIKFHFARPSFEINKWLCCFCITKQTSIKHHRSMTSQTEEETVTILPSSIQNNHTSTLSTTNSDTLRRQLHRHRLKQIRMASTFLIITVSFVLFYLPSILNAERIIKSPIMIYYLFLCTHALNPIIYCFMNPSLRKYVISMFHCRPRHKKGRGRGQPSFFER